MACCFMSVFSAKSTSGWVLTGVCTLWASGAIDNASDYNSEESRFDSWLARMPFYPSATQSRPPPGRVIALKIPELWGDVIRL